VLFDRPAESAAVLLALEGDLLSLNISRNAVNGIQSVQSGKGGEAGVSPIDIGIAVIIVIAGLRHDVDRTSCRSAGRQVEGRYAELELLDYLLREVLYGCTDDVVNDRATINGDLR